jgi:hypothetical protein
MIIACLTIAIKFEVSRPLSGRNGEITNHNVSVFRPSVLSPGRAAQPSFPAVPCTTLLPINFNGGITSMGGCSYLCTLARLSDPGMPSEIEY